MCVKLSLGDLNPDYCPSYPTSIYTCKVIIASKVCSDHLTQLIPSKRVNKLMRHIAHHLTYWKKQSKFKEPFQTYKILDMAKRAGRVRFRSGQSGHESKRVIFKRINQVAGQTGRGLSRVASWVKLTRIFQFFFFFK